MNRFGRFKDGRYDFGRFGIVGIKLNCKEEQDNHIEDGIRLVSCRHVFLSFAREWQLLFEAQFDGYTGRVLRQSNRGACTRVKLANMEMSKPPAHVRARRGLDHGVPRYDADVWQWYPPTDRGAHFQPQGAEVDMQM